MTHRKIGGIHFVKVGRFGASFYITKAKPGSSSIADIALAVCMGVMLAGFLIQGV